MISIPLKLKAGTWLRISEMLRNAAYLFNVTNSIYSLLLSLLLLFFIIIIQSYRYCIISYYIISHYIDLSHYITLC